MADHLYRSREDRVLAGVAGGIAETIDVDPSIIRIAWVLLALLTGGVALIVYIVMAVVVPERPYGVEGDPSMASAGAGSSAAPPAGRTGRRGSRDRSGGGLVAGIVLILIGGFLLIRQVAPSINLGFWWPTVAIALGIVLVVLALLPSRRPG